MGIGDGAWNIDDGAWTMRDGRYASWCCCHEQSDGSEHAEDFGSALDGGWTQFSATGTIQTSGGVLIWSGAEAGENFIHRALPSLGSGAFKVILEVDVFRRSSNTTSLAIAFGRITPTVDPCRFNAIFGGTPRYEFLPVNGVPVTIEDGIGAPQDGDRIAIILQRQTGTDVALCAFVNGVLAASKCVPSYNVSSPTAQLYFVAAGNGEAGDFDDYSSQVIT